MKTILKDPLVLFLALGAVIFMISALGSENDGNDLIEVGEPDLNRLSDQWQAQMGRPPTPQELDGLIEQFIREEAYFREAKRLSLDDGDIIVRRRLVQKLRFLTEDIATGLPPARNRIARLLRSQRGAIPPADPLYLQPPILLHGPPRRRPRRRRGRPGQRRHRRRPVHVAAVLRGALRPGKSATCSAPPSPTHSPNWSRWIAGKGPIRSAYGWHLVKLDQRLPEVLPPYGEVTNQVANDLNLERRERANEAYYENLLERYEVHRP